MDGVRSGFSRVRLLRSSVILVIVHKLMEAGTAADSLNQMIMVLQSTRPLVSESHLFAPAPPRPCTDEF